MSQNTEQFLTELVPVLLHSCDDSIGLFEGNLGKIMASLYISSALNDEPLFDESFELLTITINDIYGGKHPQTMNATLAQGMTGLGFVLQSLLADGLIENDLEAILIDIDQFVYLGTKKFLSRQNLDFAYGGLGGLYYLHRRIDRNELIRNNLADLEKTLKKAGLKINYQTLIDNYRSDNQLAMGHFQAILEKYQTDPDAVNKGFPKGLAGAGLVLASTQHNAGTEWKKILGK